MYENQMISRMNDYLHKAAKALASWLDDMLPRAGDNWWAECVLSNLSYNQRETAERKGFSKLCDLDLAALLRVADRSWYTLRGYAYLPTSERENIRDMVAVRNNWAHVSAELPGKDTIIHDIERMMRFFRQMHRDDLIPDLEAFLADVEKPGAIKKQPQSASPVLVQAAAEPAPEKRGKEETQGIPERSLVYIVGSPETKGMVFSVSILGGTRKYEVFVDGALRTYYEGQIAPVEDKTAYEWVDIKTLRSCLSAYQINHPSSGNLYSLNAARIDFVPYQFRPALKLIRADEPRILIADSVGVGKTIEAGLIIKELQARGDLENILILCPKPLVVDRKWENEMKRFDEEFIPLDGNALRQIISDTDRDGEWPSRYAKVIVPYSILDSRAYLGTKGKRNRSFGLMDLDPAPHFDLVIIDEAHHLRNGSMEKEKAFAYKCARYFCEHADAVVMLTATPLQTGDDDLFTLLNLLRPDIVIDKKSFVLMSRPNPFISQCARIIRAAKENWKAEALEALGGVLETQWGENVIAKNPVFEQAVRVLRQDTVTREERVRLITDIESLHSFDMMLSRTRRKDIQDFCVRRIHSLETDFTKEQRALHDAFLAFEAAALAELHGDMRVAFMMSTIRRQAASCIFGLAPHIRDLINRRFGQLQDDPDFDFDESHFKMMEIETFRRLAGHVLQLADDLPAEDPKFERVLEVVKDKQKSENNKIIVFSTFRYTLHYLKKRLKAAGLRVEQIDGSVGNDDRLDLRYRFELPKNNPEAIDILLFTEVGSEGLDYQFCDTMINYDLPWNPMRIEQRIGRIDRRGQMSEVVNIYNVITNGTIDADIYNRCLTRIGVFEGSIGECEEILGEIGRQIERIAMDTRLTDAERQAKLEQMADNEVRRAQELVRLESEEKELFGFDLSNYTVSREIQEAESPFLTARSIRHMVEMYFAGRLGGGRYILGDAPLKTLRLNVTARETILSDLRALEGNRTALRRQWETYLKGKNPNHPITFDPETAEKHRDAFLITPVHPLVRQAAAYFATSDLIHIHLEYFSDAIPAGDYPISIYAWNYVGMRANFRLVTVCEEPRLAAELPEYILTASSVDVPAKLKEDAWDALEARHIRLWQDERAQHAASTRQVASYKLESMKDIFQKQKIALERKIAEFGDGPISTMYRAQLENATARYRQRVLEIEKNIATADIHTTWIAKGVVTVQSGRAQGQMDKLQ